MDRLGDTIKPGRSALLRQALEARDRGNLAAAFWLLDEEHRGRPDDPAVAVAFWDVAVAYERPADAATAVAGLIHERVSGDEGELAAQYWIELTALVPDALADPADLIRIVSVLQKRLASEREDEQKQRLTGATLSALRAMIDPRNAGLTSGLAFRAAEEAKGLDRPTALAAANVALESKQLHEAKRARLIELVDELGREEASCAGSADEQTADESSEPAHPAVNHPLRTQSPPHERLSDSELRELRARLPRPRQLSKSADARSDPLEPDPIADPAGEAAAAGEQGAAAVEPTPTHVAGGSGPAPNIRVLDGELAACGSDGLSVSIGVGRSLSLAFEDIQAIAVAEIEGMGDKRRFVIDLLLDWRGEKSPPLRTVRLAAESLDTQLSVEKLDGPLTVRELLAELLDRTRAVPVPDPDAALGLSVPRFDTLEAYEREILLA